MNSVSVTVILVRLVLFIDQLPDERLQCLTHDSIRKALINSSELNEILRQIDVRPVRRQCNIGNKFKRTLKFNFLIMIKGNCSFHKKEKNVKIYLGS